MGSSNHRGCNYCFLLCNFDLFLPEGDGAKDLQLKEQLQMFIIHLFPYSFFFFFLKDTTVKPAFDRKMAYRAIGTNGI